MITFLVLFASAALAFALTGVVRVLASAAKLIDVPNERSSHAVPTPRGGGVAIVASFTIGAITLNGLAQPADGYADGLLGAGLLVAAVGAADDRWQLPAGPRLACHLAAAAWAIMHMQTLPPLPVLGLAINLGWLGPPLGALYVAWSVNFFNFMDGIDGIASLETIAVAAGGAVLNAIVLGGNSWVLPTLLSMATAGFLVWNWPPARIFMGDAGSGFLGFTVGVMTLAYASQAPVLFWGWLILQGTFLVDATTTLLRRVRRGERPQQSHRTHAYQYAARLYGGHLAITLAYGGLTLVWLFPIAMLVVLGVLDGLLALIVAYLPLVGLAFWFHAGATERQQV